MNGLRNFIEVNRSYDGKGVFKIEGTFYHLTPKDLGKIVYLEPRKPEIESFESLCVANYLFACLFALPKDKQELDSFFLYRNFQPGHAYREVLHDGIHVSEAKIFEKTKFIRVAEVKNCRRLFRKFKEHDEIIRLDDSNLLDDFSSYITVEKERKAEIILFSHAEGNYKIF